MWGTRAAICPVPKKRSLALLHPCQLGSGHLSFPDLGYCEECWYERSCRNLYSLFCFVFVFTILFI